MSDRCSPRQGGVSDYAGTTNDPVQRVAELESELSRVGGLDWAATEAARLEALAVIDKVRRYAEDRAAYGRAGRTVGSARIASDLFAIVGHISDKKGEH